MLHGGGYYKAWLAEDPTLRSSAAAVALGEDRDITPSAGCIAIFDRM